MGQSASEDAEMLSQHLQGTSIPLASNYSVHTLSQPSACNAAPRAVPFMTQACHIKPLWIPCHGTAWLQLSLAPAGSLLQLAA